MEMLNLTLKKPKRRNESLERATRVEFAPLRLAAIVILVFIGALTYALFGHQRKSLNREVLELESTKTQLSDELKRERFRWGNLKSPANMERRLKEIRTPMQPPHEKQIVYMVPQRDDARVAQRR